MNLRESHWLFRPVYGFLYGARDIKGTTLWRHENLLFLDVIASFSRTILKCWECFCCLNVFIVKFLRNWSLFPVYSFWINHSLMWSFYNPSGWCLAYLRLFPTQTLMVTISMTAWNKQDKRVLADAVCRCQFQLTERRKTTHRLPLMSGPTCLYGNRYMQHPVGLGKHVLFHVDFVAM